MRVQYFFISLFLIGAELPRLATADQITCDDLSKNFTWEINYDHNQIAEDGTVVGAPSEEYFLNPITAKLTKWSTNVDAKGKKIKSWVWQTYLVNKGWISLSVQNVQGQKAPKYFLENFHLDLTNRSNHSKYFGWIALKHVPGSKMTYNDKDETFVWVEHRTHTHSSFIFDPPAPGAQAVAGSPVGASMRCRYKREEGLPPDTLDPQWVPNPSTPPAQPGKNPRVAPSDPGIKMPEGGTSQIVKPKN